MRTIILLGELGKRYGRRHMLDVKTAAEAVRALCANFKDFAGFLQSSQERNVGYRVLNMREDLDEEGLHLPAGQRIAIVPVVAGAIKFSDLFTGVGAILTGAAIIAAAFLTGGVSIAATGFLAGGLTTTFWGGVAFGIGFSLALGGVAQLLAPTPEKPKEEKNYVFNGAVNTQAQGQPVPLGYGRMLVGSAVISASIAVDDLTTVEHDPGEFVFDTQAGVLVT